MAILPRGAARSLAYGSLFALALCTLSLLLATAARAQTPAPGQAGFASVRGTAIDSVHDGLPLVGALVRVDTTRREAVTDSLGRYVIDSIPAGPHRIVIKHPLLDTLSISLVTPLINLTPGPQNVVDVAVPSPQTLVNIFCPASWRNFGPAALVGTVRDPDTQLPVPDAKVSLLWYESDPLGLRKTPRVRTPQIGKDGAYRICGLPANLNGKLQIFRGALSSGEVPIELKDGILALRSVSIVSAQNVQVVASTKMDSAGKRGPPKIYGQARVTGKVINKLGQPVQGARVEVQGSGIATLTKANGDFSLDSLPSGTQTLEVRKLGFSATDQPVELSSVATRSVTVKLADFVATLEPVRVQAKREHALMDVGYNERKHSGAGFYMDGDQINKQAMLFSDILHVVPGIRVLPAGDGTNNNVIQSSRDPNGGCVNIFVDGTQWQQQFPGDLDSFVRPDEVGAIESYGSSSTPAQFQVAGQTSCETLVIWTERRLNRGQ